MRRAAAAAGRQCASSQLGTAPLTLLRLWGPTPKIATIATSSACRGMWARRGKRQPRPVNSSRATLLPTSKLATFKRTEPRPVASPAQVTTHLRQAQGGGRDRGSCQRSSALGARCVARGSAAEAATSHFGVMVEWQGD